MKVLFVTGSDYSALDVDNKIGIKKAVKMTEENNGELVIDSLTMYAELTLMEFGEVDPKFIEFIRDRIIDYDDSKNTDFFIVD